MYRFDVILMIIFYILDHGGTRLPDSTVSFNGEHDHSSSTSDLPYPD